MGCEPWVCTGGVELAERRVGPSEVVEDGGAGGVEGEGDLGEHARDEAGGRLRRRHKHGRPDGVGGGGDDCAARLREIARDRTRSHEVRERLRAWREASSKLRVRFKQGAASVPRGGERVTWRAREMRAGLSTSPASAAIGFRSVATWLTVGAAQADECTRSERGT
jgi:hypothetical protein